MSGAKPALSIHAPILAPISTGELLDKITILEIKAQRITDAGKLRNVDKELTTLRAVIGEFVVLDDLGLGLMDELREINNALWDVEDKLREYETRQDFGEHFIRLARSVYISNDKRALVKKKLNELTGSVLVEEKSYTVVRP